MAKGNNNHQEEDSNEQQGNNKKNMATQPAASTAGTSNFSFAMTSTSSHLTPNLNAGNSPKMHNQQDKGRREETANEQSHEQEQGQNAKAEIAKTSNQPNKNQKGGNGKNEVQNQSKTQLTGAARGDTRRIMANTKEETPKNSGTGHFQCCVETCHSSSTKKQQQPAA